MRAHTNYHDMDGTRQSVHEYSNPDFVGWHLEKSGNDVSFFFNNLGELRVFLDRALALLPPETDVLNSAAGAEVQP